MRIWWGRKLRRDFFGAALLGAGGLAFLNSCAETSGAGRLISPPTITINCDSGQCRRDTTPVAFIWITKSSCDPKFANFADAVSSAVINCTTAGGCYTSFSTWQGVNGETLSTLMAGTYSLCGRIDYNHNYPFVTNDDTIAVDENINFSRSGDSMAVTDWLDPL